MADFDYDLFVIGAGSAGVRASRMAAAHGARVAVAEDRYMGGTCVNVGCIPKKLFVYGAHFREDFEDAASFGWTIGWPEFDWQTLVGNKDKEIRRLNGIYERLLRTAGVDIVHGRAVVADPHAVEVAGKRITTERILIATGGWPVVPDFPGREHVITSNEAFHLETLPKRAIVVGGGYIAVEFAGIFNGLGVETTQIYRGPLFMRGFDQDVREHLAAEMAKKGLRLQFNTEITEVERTKTGLRATLNDGSATEADIIMYATGRAPNVAGLGLEGAGVELNAQGAIVVDDYFQTSVPSIYALGDVIDRMQLTPVALAEAMVLVRNWYDGQAGVMDYENVATAVFSQPPIGTVGLPEAVARERYGAVAIYRSTFRPLKLTMTPRDEQTMMKLIVERATDRVVGVHMVGPDAGEIIQGVGIALKAGATKADFDRTIGIHPTSAEEFVTMREPVPESMPEAAD